MKMQSAGAIRWANHLPPILARVFVDRSLKRQPAAVCDSDEAGTSHKPGQFPKVNGTASEAQIAPSTRRPEIMVPVDFSPESMQAADYAINVAQQSEARLILLHAIHLNLTPYVPANPTWLRAALCREALEKMEGTMVHAQRLGVPVISVIEEGMPSKVITAVAKRWKIDLIVLAQKRGRWARLFGHRVREKLARGAGCPVVVIQMDAKGATV